MHIRLNQTVFSKLGFVQGLKPLIDSVSVIHSQDSLALMTLLSLQQAPAGLGRAFAWCKRAEHPKPIAP